MWQNKRELVSFALMQIGMRLLAVAVRDTRSPLMLSSVLEVAKREIRKERLYAGGDIDRDLCLQDAFRIIDEAQCEWKAAA